MSSFVHLHVHSDYSPMEGVSSLEELCAAARAQGAETFALTDTNGLYGAIRFLKVAQEAGLRPILGAELKQESQRAVLLAKTADGYANLCRLLSARHCDPAFDFMSAVAHYRDGLIILSDDTEALEAWSKDSPHDLYVELTPGPLMHEALDFSRRTGIPPVATNAVRFVRPDEFAVHRLLRAIALNTTVSRLSKEACCSPTHWLAPPSTMARLCPHVPKALDNSIRIAEDCRTDWNFADTIFPAFRQLSGDKAFDLLHAKTYEGAARRYGVLTPEIRERIEYELKIIRQKGFASYFLVVDEIVQQAPRTCGRGSVAASIVSYCLQITHVDPIKHHLFFERFLSPSRKDPPDIDIDFPWDERDRVFQWVFDTYGERQAAMVANQNSLGLRAAIREVGKVYGMPSAEIGRVSAAILRQKDLVWFDKVPTAQAWSERLSQALQLAPPWPEILGLAVQVQGHFRDLALHCGGIVIVPDEISRYVPVELSAKEIATKGVQVIQWEKDQAEEAGLVKIDLLGNRSLAVIRDAIDAIERNTGRRLDYASWDPLGDPATQELIRRGDTMGCFYIESPATRLLMRKLWGGMPSDRRSENNVFDYLVVVSSLVRPAANPFIRDFIRRAQGEQYEALHPVLQDVLAETYGIMVYQEDVTKVAMQLAGFSLEDADQLRKVLSKKHKERLLRDYYRQFCEGARRHSASDEKIEKIWEMIMSFAGYSFCKPHSASYAQVSFKCAYLRVYYPAEFLAAVISNQGGYYSAFAYLSEARRMGLMIQPPDVNASAWAYSGAERTIRVGLMQIKGLNRAFADRLIEARHNGGPFRSFQDFYTRLQPDPAQTRALIRAGCFDTVAGELTRPALMWRLYASRGESRQTSDNRSLLSATVARREALPIPEDYSASRKLTHEVESFGFPFSLHPLELYRSAWEAVQRVQAQDMNLHVGEEVTMLGWPITEKMTETKKGESMSFLTLEDYTGLYEATFFPEAYRRFCQLLSEDRPYLLDGIVEKEFGTYSLTVKGLQCLSLSSGQPKELW